MRVAIDSRTLRFRAPLRTAFGTLATRDLLVLRLETDDGLVGLGEAAPLTPYDGVTLDDTREALGRCEPLLLRSDARDRGALLDACAAAARLPQALAAIDSALWDIAGKRSRQPIAALLANDAAAEIVVNGTVGAGADPPTGYGCLKVKVGLDDDVARVGALRALVGADVALRVDANGAWQVDQAVRRLAELQPFGIELAEEPVHGTEALRLLRERVEIPIAMDETAAEPGALESGATDFVCLKLARCGGITAALAAAAAARSTGSEVYLASSFDGPIGIAAALHAAAAIRPPLASGLATLALFDEPDPFPARDGAIAVPDGPGLGLG